MTLKCWNNFSKRRNSSKRPSDSDAISKTVYLKENTNLSNPVFLLNSQYIPFMNYCSLSVEGNVRYYFINDVVYVSNGLYELHCAIDVLATYKISIGSSTFYVERSASQYDQYIADSVLSTRGFYVNSSYSQSDLLPDSSPNGTYLLTVSGGNASAGDFGVTTYACTSTMIKQILDFIFNDENFVSEFTDGAVKTFFNPFQYILSLKWVPFNTSIFGTDFTEAVLGWWGTGVNVLPVKTTTKRFVLNCSIPTHIYTDFRRYSPVWTHHRIFLPSVGLVDISPSDILSSSISAEYTIDWVSGQSYIRVSTDSDTVVCERTGNFAVDVQISQNASNIVNGVSQIAGGVIGSIMNPFSIPSGISSAISGVQEVLQPTVSTNGQGGNKSIYQFYPRMEMWTEEVASTDYQPSQVGRPLCQSVQISSLSGYIQCAGASYNGIAFGDEKNMINSYLNGGFFYE